MELDKIDIEILYVMLTNESISAMQSFDIKSIIKNTDLKLSYHTIFRRISKKLIPLGYLLEGYKVSNARTFYLSESAIEYLKVNILEKENVFDLEETLEQVTEIKKDNIEEENKNE